MSIQLLALQIQISYGLWLAVCGVSNKLSRLRIHCPISCYCYIDAGSISFSNAPPPAEIAVTSTGLLFVADSTSIVPLGGALQISECLGTRDNYFIDDIIVVSSGK